MSKTHLVLLCLILGLLPVNASAGDGALAPLEQQMSREEFEQMGLGKLSADERARLSAWVAAQKAGAIKVAATPVTPSTPAEPESAPASGIRAKVTPAFTGWSGKTVFTLDNGQVWKQRQSGRLQYTGDSADVVIRKKRFGFWFLEHLETGKSIGVTRVD